MQRYFKIRFPYLSVLRRRFSFSSSDGISAPDKLGASFRPPISSPEVSDDELASGSKVYGSMCVQEYKAEPSKTSSPPQISISSAMVETGEFPPMTSQPAAAVETGGVVYLPPKPDFNPVNGICSVNQVCRPILWISMDIIPYISHKP